jgi:hypothetical protein
LVSKFSAVASIDPAEDIAKALQQFAADIRAGTFPVPVTRALLIVSAPDGPQSDGVGMLELGPGISTIAKVGLLEIAKHQLLIEAGED